ELLLSRQVGGIFVVQLDYSIRVFSFHSRRYAIPRYAMQLLGARCLGDERWRWKLNRLMEFARRATNFQYIRFDPEELVRHCYLVGQSGSGKSTALINHTRILIEDGETVIFLDPHGSSADTLVDCIPSWRTRDTIYLDLSDIEYAVGFNPFLSTHEK